MTGGREEGGIYGGEAASGELLKEWTDKYCGQDGERGREMEEQWSGEG